MLGDLLASLDLRFEDPLVESLYYNYYAQVKRHLLPTAIQVVLSVNVLQLCASCLHFYFLANETTRPLSRPLILPFIIQLAILVLTCVLLKMVRNELDPADRYGRRRFSSTGQAGNKGRNSKSNKSNSRQSSGSGLSASLSLTIRAPLEQGQSSSSGSSSESSESSSSSSSDDERDPSENKMIQLNKTGSRKSSSEKKRQNNRRSHSSSRHSKPCSSRGSRKISRCKLSLPYLLWCCQVIQLACGLWPQQSFISYATLLLYTYTIYVIFPIRLMNCILLALGLSIIQPLLDYLLLFNLEGSVALQSQSGRQPMTQTAAINAFGVGSDGDTSFAASLLAAPPTNLIEGQIGASNSNYFTASNSLANQLAADSLLLLQMAAESNASDLSTNSELLTDNSLLIPMTSQLSKLWAFMLLALGINVIGVMSFFFYERQQRAAFLETRQSLETKLTLEQESQEQERLLLSILPEHLADEIREDLGAVVTGQFKKIYMSRHENVSILFADIVGFTAISSHCPAAELVKTLNELFARFDKLAEKYHQLRIKILGDCYYAISGAPVERPDHAVLCVHMGLSMVDAIKSVREKTKSTVDMRVGVHTGGVLAGVLGQRQWQFDVYSKDVELANKMESSGLPGRVHISNATLRFLNHEFEVSDGHGASREEALRMANIQTYFIDRVLKPYPEGTLDFNLEQRASQDSSTARSDKTAPGNKQRPANKQPRTASANANVNANTAAKHNNQLAVGKSGGPGKGGAGGATAAAAAAGEKQTANGNKERNDSFHADKQIKCLSLNFFNSQFESQFRSTSDIASCVSLIGLPITLLCAFLAYLYLYNCQTEVTIVYAICFLIILSPVLVCILPYLVKLPQLADNKSQRQRQQHQQQQQQQPLQSQPRQQCLSRSFGGIASTVKQSAWMKLALTAFMTLVWLTAHLNAGHQTGLHLKQLSGSLTLQLFAVDLFNYFAIACSLAITAVTRISFLVKTSMILIVIILQVIMNVTLLSNVLSVRLLSSPVASLNHLDGGGGGGGGAIGGVSGNYTTSATIQAGLGGLSNKQDDHLTSHLALIADSYHLDQSVFTLTLIAVCWALFLINRQFELTNRRLFLWRKQADERKEKVADMRQKNEALVYNILPPNVAKIFLSKQINDEELYSKSYEAVGVLFAAMPNFSDFYTEESVNNQGLECLRFLNEVISDYDALLDQDRFKNIIKIKTMGSTYMAASGLHEDDAEAARALEAAGGSSKRGSETSQQLVEADRERQRQVEVEGHQAPVSPEDEVRNKWAHLEQLTEFSLALKDTLNNINKESFNNFVLRIGINQGPITAGVIGVKKPHFDMWGNTVNVASRMESTGRAGSIQVVEETATILRHFGFQFDQRGLVSVKGKGKLMTFYLTGREQVAAPVATTTGGSPSTESARSAASSGAANAAAQVVAPSAQQRQQQQQQQPSCNTNDRRIFITSSKSDQTGDSIHLV